LEAAEYLLRIPSVLLLVDGYNVSNAIWSGLPLPDQRTRLIDALGELHARTGAAVQIVFDGAVGQGPWVAGGRQAVQVRFSPPEVEADDVLVEVIAGEPPGRVVVLATSDRELRDRARRLGANLLRAGQLSAAMHR
jgi:predicted RNA-binding protein with PIN domain